MWRMRCEGWRLPPRKGLGPCGTDRRVGRLSETLHMGVFKRLVNSEKGERMQWE